MNKQYFIILNMPNNPLPITTEDDELALYESIHEARDAMDGHMAAEAFGYEVFCLGEGW